jgi:hypothetical protein
MSSVEEFIEIRKSIEALAREITVCLDQNAVEDSKRHLEKANSKLETLRTMVANDVQVIVEGRLSRLLVGLGEKVNKAGAKSPAKKKPAGKKVAEKKPAMPVKTDSGEVPEINVFERP